MVGAEEDIKSGLLWAFSGNSNSNEMTLDYKRTIGVNFGINSVYLDDFTIKLQIWDISFDTRHECYRHLYFRGASGCVMIVRSLQEAQTFFEDTKTYCSKPIPILFIYIGNEPLDTQLRESIPQINIKSVTNGYEGIEWLAEAMYSSRRKKDTKVAALYSIGIDEIQETLNAMHQAQIRSEMERLEIIRQQRLEQLEFVTETLREMGFLVVEDTVQIFSSDAFICVNILTGNVEISPLKCERCQNLCKNLTRKLCIIKKTEGWSIDLDQNSLLILSKIYALANNQLPKHVLNQIKNALHCPRYRRVSPSVEA